MVLNVGSDHMRDLDPETRTTGRVVSSHVVRCRGAGRQAATRPARQACRASGRSARSALWDDGAINDLEKQAPRIEPGNERRLI